MGLRLVFMGSDPIALPGLEAITEGQCGEIEIVAVYTQPDRPRGRGKKVQPNEIKTWALQKGYPVLQPEKLGKAERLELADLNADCVLVMAYGHILSQKILDTPDLGIWNLHTSLLPKYRGASPIQCAIASGDSETGVSFMKLVREMDAGPVLDTEKVSIGEKDTALDIEANLAAACVPLLKRSLPVVASGNWELRDQDPAAASYVRKLGKEDGALDFRESAEVLARRVNGLYPWPGTRALLDGQQIKFGLAISEGAAVNAVPGTVLQVDSARVRVACGSGQLSLLRLQRPGGKMLDAADFARGFPLQVGSVFESSQMTELVTATHVSS